MKPGKVLHTTSQKCGLHSIAHKSEGRPTFLGYAIFIGTFLLEPLKGRNSNGFVFCNISDMFTANKKFATHISDFYVFVA